MAYLDALNASATAKYDNTNHAAAPMRLQWLTRKGYLSDPRWVFLRCCGQIGATGTDDIVRSRLRCDRAVPTPARGHGGDLQLHGRNASRTQARLHGGSLATWSCCGTRALTAWEAAWDGVGRVSLLSLAANGCTAGIDAPPARPMRVVVDCDRDEDNLEYFTPTDGNFTAARSGTRHDDASASYARVAAPLHPVPCPPTLLPRPIPALSWQQTLRAHVRPSSVSAAAIDTAAALALVVATPPTPSRAVEAVLRDTFGLSLAEAATSLWPRGAGGDGACELLAARGDRLLEWEVVQQLPPSLHAEHDIATHTTMYTSNAALAAAARALALHDELRARMGGREPSDHELGTVVEALLMAAFIAKGMDVAKNAVRKLMSILDELHPFTVSRAFAGEGSVASPAGRFGTAVEQLMHHALRLRLSLPLFEVETDRSGDGEVRVRVRILVVECSAEGGEQDLVLVTGPWEASRRAAREHAAAALLEA